jgi:hypothetical protein
VGICLRSFLLLQTHISGFLALMRNIPILE